MPTSIWRVFFVVVGLLAFVSSGVRLVASAPVGAVQNAAGQVVTSVGTGADACGAPGKVKSDAAKGD